MLDECVGICVSSLYENPEKFPFIATFVFLLSVMLHFVV